MHIICPNCGLKSPVETGGLTVETRLVCTRCEVEFEIRFTDEPGAEASSTEIALFESFAETLEEKLGTQPAPPSEAAMLSEAATPSEVVTPSEADSCDVLGLETLPLPPAAEEETWEQEGLVLEQSQPLVLDQQPQSAADDQSADAQQEDEDDEGVSGAYPLPNFTREPVHAAQRFDKYNVGVRLMQASPMWLLVTGLSFISFIVLCNWFFVPANLAQADPSRPAARGNHATNMSAGHTVAPSQPTNEIADAREEDDARPATRPAEPSARTAEQMSVESAPASSPTPAPTQTPAPAAVTTSAPADAAREKSAGSSPAPDGKFTLQVGSYNVAAEAEARASSLKAAGVEARVAQVEIPKRGTWFRVQAGRFASREEAERGGRQLREKGLAASYLTAALQ